MTLFVGSAGKRITVHEIVTDTTPVTIQQPSSKAYVYTVESASVRLKGTDVGFDFSIDDGSSDVSVAGTDSFGSETYWRLADHHPTVEFGKTLKFTADGASELHVTVVMLESDTSGQGRQ